MRVEFESSVAAASTSLITSFLPGRAQLLQLKLAQCSFPKKGFQCIAASTKQKKKARKSPSPGRGWSYEHFMVLWDEVFGHCCTDTVKATEIRTLAHKGLAKHGRGCVLVYQEVQTRPRGEGVGFTSKPPKTSRKVPDFVTLEYHAVYLPREFLLDPRKAPLDENTAASDDEHSSTNAGDVVVEKQGGEISAMDNVTGRQQKEDTDNVIDIEDIIREAQNVYSFYSDDEDELDDEMLDGGDSASFSNNNSPTESHNVKAIDAKKVDAEYDFSANDSLIILDDPIESNPHLVDPPVILDEKVGISAFGLDVTEGEGHAETECAAETQRFDNNVSPSISSDNDEIDNKAGHYASKPLLSKARHENNLTAKDEHLFMDDFAEREYPSAAVCSTPAEGRDNYSVGEVNAGTGALLKEDDRVSEVQIERNGSTHIETNRPGADITTTSTADFIVETVEDDVSESHELMAYVKGSEIQYNEILENEEVPLTTQQMLYACMRGVDRTRLMSLTANFDFEAERFRFARRMAVIDVKSADAGGEDPYNPNQEELVLLLHLCIDGKPAYGADVLVAYRDELQTESIVKDSWKLKGKYKQIVE